MKEQWAVEAEQTAKDLAEILAKRLCECIIEEADVLCVDRKWYFEKVVQYMTEESGDAE